MIDRFFTLLIKSNSLYLYLIILIIVGFMVGLLGYQVFHPGAVVYLFSLEHIKSIPTMVPGAGE